MAYAWIDELEDDEVPPLVTEGLSLLGDFDVNELIDEYDIPYVEGHEHDPSGVWMHHMALSCGHEHSWNPYRPKSWCRFGTPLPEGEELRFGDIVLFYTKMLHAVGVLIGYDRNTYHVLGVTQNKGTADISRISKELMMSARRVSYPSGKLYMPVPRLTNTGDRDNVIASN